MIKPENLRTIAHLLGEAFPDSFTMTFVIGKKPDGTLNDRCDAICNPNSQAEIDVLHEFMRRLDMLPPKE